MADYNDLRGQAAESREKRNGQYAKGGGVHDDEAQDKALIKTMLAKEDKSEKRADGGAVLGLKRGGHANRPGHKTVVNVISAPGAGGGGARPVPVPVPVGGGPPGMPPGAMPPRPAMGGMGPMGPPPGPGAGGPILPPGMPPRARGGSITGGALSGVGRLEKKAGGVKGPMIMRE